MDDRHTFSDPRPASGYKKPTWEVDVFRKGVDHPVFTLVVNDDTLPPRMRKKKVVWRLPHDHDTLPNFGSDEKRRLVDLFKEQKKTRRKSKRSPSSGGESPDSGSVNPADDYLPDSPVVVVKKHDFLKERSKTDENIKDGHAACEPKEKHIPPPTPPLLPASTMLPKKSTPPPPGLSMPPGLELSKSDSAPQPHLVSPPEVLDPLLIHEDSAPQGESFFSVPLTSVNIPIDLAQIFMDIYYCSMTHGQQEDLLMHFVKNSAVKSLSLGGAHSFCKTPTETLQQLNSLQGSLWDVSGVVAQEGLDESVVLLLTGTCLPKTSPQPLPFCHSVTLARIQPGCYQIHNDAMSLMTLSL